MSESLHRLFLILGSTFFLAIVVFGGVLVLQMPAQSTLTAAAVTRTATPAKPTPTVRPTTIPATASPRPNAVAGTTPAATPLPAHGTRLVAPELYTYRVVSVFPHDPTAFTEGLFYEDGLFYEGTGNKGASTLRRIDAATGVVQQSHQLADEFFGEGIVAFGDKIYQLTWQEHTGFVYDKATFSELARFQYPSEGWGMTHDGQRLIVSDGTATLQFWDPTTLQQTGTVVATLFGFPVSRLNELEYIGGEVFANVWQTNLIMRINPSDGQVTGVIDLTGLLDYAPPATTPVDVLNGIAYDAATGRIFVTGKYWPALFEIELVEVTNAK